MQQANIAALKKTANELRRNIITMIYEAQSGHPGGSLSIADFITACYWHAMNVDPAKPRWSERDRFVLSKGHTCPAQYAALAAFTPETIRILEARRAEFRRRRDFLAPALETLGLRVTARPEGAFYLYCDSSALAPDSFTLARDLLEQAGVACTPGLDFGQHAPEKHLRFAYTTDISRLGEAVERLATYFNR